MDHQRRFLLYLSILIAVWLRIPLTHAQNMSTEVGLPPHSPQTRTNVTTYAWSAWGAWSPCSRTCGGGVAVQERHCLPRDPTRWRRSRKRRKLVRSTERIRRTRNAGATSVPDCPGLARRYHECNTTPCPGPVRDPRTEQCAVYDRRPFRGRFYTWVPYVDGNAPCILNCRPRGQQFYASLALVADGTPCTKPGYRAICVQGSCKVVGREDVLATTANRDMQCGRRLVSGLFSRPRLPLGYSYVTTIPRGACRLNVSEIVTSENYIALRVSNGSYIMNGEFAVSAPGTYEAAGARFIYSRSSGLDKIFAMGPIHHPVDIMVLYTQPNPNIKYEYLTDSLPDETSNDIPTSNSEPEQNHHQIQRHHRHHNAESHTRALEKSGPSLSKQPDFSSVENQYQLDTNVIGDRKFVWKIVSYTQCSRTCGGGLQIGKFKCVELDGKEDREVSPAHCSGTPPASRRRRCGVAPCPPRWRAAAWGPCPVCGPAHRTRIVGCVQDHARGITKISDQKCPLPMPPSEEACEIPNCDGKPASEVSPRLDARRQVRPNDRVDTFREGPVISLASNVSDNEISLTHEPKYSFTAAGGWLYTEWSECVGWCVGGGLQTRAVRCADPSGCPRKSPESSRNCAPTLPCEPHDGHWFMGDWSPCSSPCGGMQVRGVLCIGGSGRHLRDSACKDAKPEHQRKCGNECPPAWYSSEWGQCTGNCTLGVGIQRRTVVCARGDGSAAGDDDCTTPRPHSNRACEPKCTTEPTIPPDLTIESQKSGTEIPATHTPASTTQRNYNTFNDKKDCEDKLPNCSLAVQARLCHYKYYIQNCCDSCKVT